MPVTLVSRLGRRNEFAEFKSVLNDAGGRVMRPVDAEMMARELVQSGGRDYVEMVRELTTALANAERELADANRRYERLTESLAKRGIRIEDECLSGREETPSGGAGDGDGGQAEWEEWDRKFRSLLD